MFFAGLNICFGAALGPEALPLDSAGAVGLGPRPLVKGSAPVHHGTTTLQFCTLRINVIPCSFCCEGLVFCCVVCTRPPRSTQYISSKQRAVSTSVVARCTRSRFVTMVSFGQRQYVFRWLGYLLWRCARPRGSALNRFHFQFCFFISKE
jgi:hypothetical protein